MLETKNETSVPVVRVPLVNVTVRTPLTRVAVAAGLAWCEHDRDTVVVAVGLALGDVRRVATLIKEACL